MKHNSLFLWIIIYVHNPVERYFLIIEVLVPVMQGTLKEGSEGKQHLVAVEWAAG